MCFVLNNSIASLLCQCFCSRKAGPAGFNPHLLRHNNRGRRRSALAAPLKRGTVRHHGPGNSDPAPMNSTSRIISGSTPQRNCPMPMPIAVASLSSVALRRRFPPASISEGVHETYRRIPRPVDGDEFTPLFLLSTLRKGDLDPQNLRRLMMDLTAKDRRKSCHNKYSGRTLIC